MKKSLAKLLMSLFILFSAAAQPGKDYNKFIDIVKNELKQIHIKNYEEHFDEEYFIVKEENDYFDVGTEVGLTNLYSICAQNDKSQWNDIVKNHFAQVKVSRAEEKAIMPKLKTFETGKEFLKLRIYPIVYKNQFSESSIFECTTDDYISVVVIDFPSAVKNLTKEYTGKWNVSEKEIIEAAKSNTLKNNNEEFQECRISESFYVSIMYSDTNIFITSSIYDLNKKIKSISKYGAFVAIPNRYGIIVKNISKDTVNTDIVQMIGLVNYMYQQGPASITDSIYWFDGKKFYKVIHDPSRGMIKLPDELVKILK
ncbi:hypothetical protein [Treponema sp.]|uniref:hypothetical protein n=1 Tax=Treponema sp. TaxID=166 RepID=UPI00298EACDF|nr:hypothetical protein [Treponema sp.]MCR5612054.1 hypothetical protein [Treponema sp.]